MGGIAPSAEKVANPSRKEQCRLRPWAASRQPTQPRVGRGWEDGPVQFLPEKVEDVLEWVEQIPEGRVLTYGDVAELVGGRGARFVGNVMSRYGSEMPWWRVVRAGGWPPRGLEERALEHYREESTPMVRGTLDGCRVDLSRARWAGPPA